MPVRPKIRPQDLERTDESQAVTLSDFRDDEQLSMKFRRRIKRFCRNDPERGLMIAVMLLRECGGWSLQMLAMLTGRSTKGVSEYLTESKSLVTDKQLLGKIDRTQSFTALQTINVETVLNRLASVRHLLAADDIELDGALHEAETKVQARRDAAV